MPLPPKHPALLEILNRRRASPVMERVLMGLAAIGIAIGSFGFYQMVRDVGF
jgi:hypothetical protein